jgi:pyridoxine 5-phosphate synthase
MNPRLGVNIDHVATLRQARGESYPSVVEAARVCLEHGADQITIHLREDRRHIQDTDLAAIQLVTKRYGKPLNLEMGASEEIVEIAIATSPDWICLVPENRLERTTEGGLNLKDEKVRDKINNTCKVLKDKIPGVKISLFLEADTEILSSFDKELVDAVEIHTGDYAMAAMNGESTESYLNSFKSAALQLKKMDVGCHAGHGLTDSSVKELLDSGLFAEYNIGHWIICEAVFFGLAHVVDKLKKQFLDAEVDL